MNEKELLSQLHNLTNIKPDEQWKRSSREILLSQLSNRSYQSVKISLLNRFAQMFAQPVLVVSMIIIIVFGGGIFSLSAARNTKPGDSFYIAKIISEKAQLAITFDQEDKAKLGLGFAKNRAQEISQVLADIENKEEKTDKVEKLAKNFKKEISFVRTRLKQISETGDTQMFSANLGRDDNGVEVYDSNKEGSDTNKPIQEEVKKVAAPSDAPANISSSTKSSINIEQVLVEVEKLFADEDYNGTLNKLEEINVIIDKGEVKGESESAPAATGGF